MAAVISAVLAGMPVTAEVKVTACENYLTEQLPVLWRPNFVSSITG